MVLTDQVNRRQLLRAVAGGAGVTALAGCGLFDDDPEPAPEPDALQPVLDEAIALAASYERAAAAQPGLATRLAPIIENHRAHAGELSKVIGVALPSAAASGAASSASAGGDSDATVAELRKAEQAAQKTAAAACKAAPADRAAMVGSITAARAAHAEALR